MNGRAEKKDRNPLTESRYALERFCFSNEYLSAIDSLVDIDSVIEEHL